MHLFTQIRLVAYLFAIACSTVVVGITGDLASKFLPNLHKEFGYYSLVTPSLTIVVLTILLLRSQPRIDVFFAVLLAILWLTMGGWSVDIISGVQCDALGRDRTPIKNGRTMSSQMYCREMKVIEAFSWANFVILTVSIGFLVALTTRAQTLGRHHAWALSITDLPWFGEYSASHNGGQSYTYPNYAGSGYVVHQQPGHSVLIQQGQGGQVPSIQQVPGTVVSA